MHLWEDWERWFDVVWGTTCNCLKYRGSECVDSQLLKFFWDLQGKFWMKNQVFIFFVWILGFSTHAIMSSIPPCLPNSKVFISYPKIDPRLFAKGEQPSGRCDSEKVSLINLSGVEIKLKVPKGFIQLFSYILVIPWSLKQSPSSCLQHPVVSIKQANLLLILLFYFSNQ